MAIRIQTKADLYSGFVRNNLFAGRITYDPAHYRTRNRKQRRLPACHLVNRGPPAGFRMSGLSEAEAVLVYKNGTYALIEIKLGDDEAIDEAAKNLLKLQEDLIQKPLYLMVITKSRYAYKRDDGVYVVPLATLRN